MKQYLEYIKEVIDIRLEGTISTFENLVSLFIMNDEASNNEISKCDMQLNKKLPDEYKFFLQNYNGGILFKIEDYAGFNFLSTNELIRHNEFQRENFDKDWDDEILLFCECIGDAEYLGFKSNMNGDFQIVYCIMDMLPQEWDVIEDSFEILMKRLIEEKGKKYWLDY